MFSIHLKQNKNRRNNMFQKKKGFTLIELLAVIVILAVIALIATPLIMNVINDAKKNSFKDSAYGIIKAVELRVMEEEQKQTATGGPYKVDVAGTSITYSGDKPTQGMALIDRNGNITLYMKNDSFCAKKEANTTEITVTSTPGDCDSGISTINGTTATTLGPSSGEVVPPTPSIPEPVAFATDSWATINQAVKSNNISAYNVGDTKEVTMDVNEDGENETYHIMVVNTTACTTETSETACGLVLQFQELLNITNYENEKMNSTGTNAGGWPATTMRTYLNGDVYNKLKAAIGDIIVETKAISGHEKNKTENYPSQDYLYLLSTKEVGFDIDYDSAKAETRKLDYYSDNASKIKYNYGTTTAASWWLRAAHSGSTTGFNSVDAGGSVSSRGANSTCVVAPAFRVGK